MTLTTQLYTMLAMTGMGAWLGASLDTYRLFVSRAKTARWLLFIHDILFWIVQGLLFFYVLLNVNEGELRVYIFLAVLLGIATYQSLFKRMYIKILKFAIHLAVSLYQFAKKLIQHVLFRPVLLLFKLLIGLITVISLYSYRVSAFFAKCLFKIVAFLLYPLFFLLKQLLKLLPEKWRLTFKRYFQKSAGFLQKSKKLIITIRSTMIRILKR
ncbi:spore cortex biosynthesis protein YabQ [Bacillus velezensis]|uniref:spore cortex biosynthesis protein YabQ n=1 Tax=Bacillus amyloliquefaciens group TaxID=1938374 RepID=UPI000399CF43|nr:MULTISPECIES: spore cortex biosynthesis protein YabQ [Bacillus amyloliquefaciens group]AUJ60956.1 spore cortex biosynthesis protein YabQ [Bacillus velezensis]MBI0444263.1 spore cortex biosynthesis protein YabQ [Bacillus velezensis]MCC9266079.1 spore cortex biosynthesis protein YabQ [Bacillus velezensis]NIG99521.1 spore cortex biosynthesis protein YabQ [Bacillus amyloliquefaciens]QNQ50283.1 spore cortex biosynthesis protein YabQ [Bacillus velezensis]